MVVQLVTTTVVALAFGLLHGGGWSALSVFCGGLISLSVLLLLQRGVRRASEVALVDQKKSMMILYLGAVQRFVLIIALFALGLRVLGLAPLEMLVGFAAAQASNIVSARM
ncbi:MAG: ATP synthase subunit I [Gallionellaceae bacterium]